MFHGEARNSAFIPFDAETQPFRYDCSANGAVRLDKDGAGQIEILEPVGGRRNGQQMRTGLNEDMAGY